MTRSLRRGFDTTALRLLSAGLVLAVAGTLTLTATAAPGEGRHHGRMHHHGAMMGGGDSGLPMLGGRHAARLLDAVGATPEQRAQIRQIVQAARTDLRAQREGRRALREQSMALFAQPTVDARAAEALRQQMVAQHDATSKRVTQAMVEVSRVLTPEQRQKIAERFAERRAMMERHRAERASKAPRQQ